MDAVWSWWSIPSTQRRVLVAHLAQPPTRAEQRTLSDNLTKPGMPADADDRNVDLDRAPLREPPITADPLVLREPPTVIRELEPAELGSDNSSDDSWTEPQRFVPLPPDLPPPIMLDEPMLNPAEVLLDEPSPAVMPPPALPPLPPVPVPVVQD